MATEERALAAAVAASSYGALELSVDLVITSLRIVTLLDGAAFAPRSRLLLPAGAHRIVATTTTRELTADAIIVAGKAVGVTLAPENVPAAPPAPAGPLAGEPARPVPLPPERSGRRTVPGALLIGGGIALVAGAVLHATVVRSHYNDLDAAPTDVEYARLEPEYARWRNVTVGVYAVGAVAVLTGAVLRLTSAPRSPQVSADLGADRAMLTVGWVR